MEIRGVEVVGNGGGFQIFERPFCTGVTEATGRRLNDGFEKHAEVQSYDFRRFYVGPTRPGTVMIFPLQGCSDFDVGLTD